MSRKFLGICVSEVPISSDCMEQSCSDGGFTSQIVR